MTVGERKVSRRRLPAGYRVERVTAGHAYGRNGNAHNPTARYRWETLRGDGTLVGHSTTERDAVKLALDEFHWLLSPDRARGTR